VRAEEATVRSIDVAKDRTRQALDALQGADLAAKAKEAAGQLRDNVTKADLAAKAKEAAGQLSKTTDRLAGSLRQRTTARKDPDGA